MEVVVVVVHLVGAALAVSVAVEQSVLFPPAVFVNFLLLA